ncbi:MAG: Ig-like domain-containing protein [Gemmatimonadales bacterium]
MIALGAILCLAGCQDRERLVFPAPGGDAAGPAVGIILPSRDTTIQVGGTVFVRGFAFDSDGVDSIWFTLQGAPFSLSPIHAGGSTDTAFFSWTFNPSAFPDTGTVRLFVTAVDLLSDTSLTKSLSIKVIP